jgi:outer membrane biosynthesis protein TonB
MPEDNKKRKRVVVEEVGADLPAQTEDVLQKPSEDTLDTLDEVKEKVEELQNLTEEIGESAEKSAEIEEEIVEVAEKASPVEKPEEEKTVVSTLAPPPYPKKNGMNPLVILIPGVLLLGALLGGIYFYQKSIKTTDGEPSPTPSVQTSTKPSATPSSQVDLTKYTVAVQNGSGIAGEAGKVKTLLEGAGFKVGTTGNAPSYDFEETIIKTKSTVDKAYLDKLTETLKGSYKVGDNETLPESSKDDVIVIVGSSKAE